jgi:nucleotide-binding universal stress UspA family protein
MKNILIPIDFSDCSFNALLYALNFTRKLEYSLKLLHALKLPVIPPNSPAGVADNMIEQTAKERDKELRSFYNKALTTLSYSPSDYSVDFKILKDFSAPLIDLINDEADTDLIIMGTLGATGAKKLIGSNAAAFVQKSECAVLVIPDKYKFRGLNKVIIADDYKNKDNMVFNVVRDIISGYGPDTELIHIVKQGEKLKSEDMVFRLKQNILDKHTVMYADNKDISGIIHDEAEKQMADLLVIKPREHGFFERLENASVSKELAFITQIPLLAVAE